MSSELSKEELDSIFLRLSEPFNLADVQWVVKSTAKDGKSALVAPYADPRAYHRRLDEIVTPAGWQNEYKNQIVPGLTRMIKDRPVPSGKVSIVCSLSIFQLGTTKSATGEMWADDENAVTRAEAQSFKRACAMFGLGAYFYRIKNGADGVKLWVNYDAQKRRITQEPKLPDWALSKRDLDARAQKKSAPARQAPANQATAAPQTATVAESQPGTQAKRTNPTGWPTPEEAKSVNYPKDLGQPLYASIVDEIDSMVKEGKITGNRDATLKAAVKNFHTTLEAVRSAAADLPVGTLEATLNRCGIERLDQIPNYKALRQLAKELPLPEKAAA